MHDIVEVCRSLLGGEAQIGRAYLDQVAAHPEPGEGQAGVGPRADDDMDVGRQVIDEESELLVDVPPVDQVEVVQDQDEGCLTSGELVEEDRHEALVRLHRRGQIGKRRASPGRGRLQCGDDVGPERRGLAVAFIEREPGDRQTWRRRVGQPIGEQRRLAKARWRRDEGEPGLEAAVEQRAKPRSRHDTGSQEGQVQFGGNEWQGHFTAISGPGRVPKQVAGKREGRPGPSLSSREIGDVPLRRDATSLAVGGWMSVRPTSLLIGVQCSKGRGIEATHQQPDAEQQFPEELGGNG